MHYNIFIDGSCLDNGKETAKAGWGVIVCNDEYKDIHTSKGKIRPGKQTNNRAELESAVVGLLWIKNNTNDSDTITIYSDSRTVVEGINGCGGRNANRDIWEDIEKLCPTLIGRVEIVSVASHKYDSIEMVHIKNNECDKLAKAGAFSLLDAPFQPIV